MSKRTLFLIFALFIITVVLLAITLYKPSSQPSPIIIAPKEPVEQTVLSFGNLSSVISTSSSALKYSLPIDIATGNNKVTAVQLEMQYDPEILTNVSITPGVFFANPNALLNQIDIKTGRITYAFGIGLTEQGVLGIGTVATLNFSVIAGAPQQTSILFLPKTLVTAEGISGSVKKQANNIQITVGETISTPSSQ